MRAEGSTERKSAILRGKDREGLVSGEMQKLFCLDIRTVYSLPLGYEDVKYTARRDDFLRRRRATFHPEQSGPESP